MKCGTCIHARWQLTPTGRIKKHTAGKCQRQGELLNRAKQASAPCLVVNTSAHAIWPDFSATNCPEWKEKQP